MTLLDLTAYYGRLLAYQFRGKPNATRQIELYAKQAVADFFAAELLSAFDLELAVGDQLDTIGKYVGVSRNIGPANPPPLFSLWTYSSAFLQAKYLGVWNPLTNTPALPVADSGNDGKWYVASESGVSTSSHAAGTFSAGDLAVSVDGLGWLKQVSVNGNGLTTYSDSAVNAAGVFYSYSIASRQVSALPDESYRAVIKLKIVLNSIDGTLYSIIAYLRKFFPDLVFVQDTKMMHLHYIVLSTVPISVDLLKLYLPKPMGVGIDVTIVNPTPSGGGIITTEDGSPITTEDGSPITTEDS